MSEQDIRTKFITPAIIRAGWDIDVQVREEVTFTKGRIQVRGRMHSRDRASIKRADYVLYYKSNIPIALIEAKDYGHALGDGMQQGLGYAESLGIPFVFSSNGTGFLFHDRTGQSSPVERELALDAFPPPEELWRRYRAWKGLESEPAVKLVTQDYHDDGSGKAPRYYQLNAINRTLEAVAKGQNRILLVMATGTGKTYTAFQIIWRLWKSGARKRILFLADRNILVDQTKSNDFRPFDRAMTKIKDRKADPSYEIYLALYQQLTGEQESDKIFKEFSPGFFDLIVVDECHRGSAAEDSAWREILDYFSSATQIGMTATPKETAYVSNIHYFGEPVYTYSLRQGIEDGFLAPYKVVRIDLDRDLTGWRPEEGKTDKHGQEIEDRIYNQKDFDRQLVMEKRTRLVAEKVVEFLKATDPYDKTIVFCEDIDHAERMRQAITNAFPEMTAQNRKYVMRITGDDLEGKMELDSFIDPEKRYPVIAVTSRLLSTGVDAQTCKLIVLDQRIQSMTMFKQIIGRGTRINEDYGKFYFTIMDFKKATELFADPDFDGDPVVIYTPPPGASPVPPDEAESQPAPPDGSPGQPDPSHPPLPLPPDGGGMLGGEWPGSRRVRYYVDDVEFKEAFRRVQYYGKDGRLITESVRDFTRRALKNEFATLDDFLRQWGEAERKQAIVEEMEAHDIQFDWLAEEVGRDYDPFDLVCHIAFDQPPLTRRERAERVRKRDVFTRYGEEARAVLTALLEKYADTGPADIEDINVLKVPPLRDLGTPVEIINRFGGRDRYLAAVRELERELYRSA